MVELSRQSYDGASIDGDFVFHPLLTFGCYVGCWISFFIKGRYFNISDVNQ